MKKNPPLSSEKYDSAPPHPKLHPSKPQAPLHLESQGSGAPGPLSGTFDDRGTLQPTKPLYRNPEKRGMEMIVLPLRCAGKPAVFAPSSRMASKEKFVEILRIAEFARSFAELFNINKKKITYGKFH